LKLQNSTAIDIWEKIDDLRLKIEIAAVAAVNIEKLILTRMLAIIAEMDESDSRKDYIHEVEELAE